MIYTILQKLLLVSFCLLILNAQGGKQSRESVLEDEAKAVECLRLIYRAEATYQSQAGDGNFGSARDLFINDLIDPNLADASNVGTSTSKSGKVCKGSGLGINNYHFQVEFSKLDKNHLSHFSAVAIFESEKGRAPAQHRDFFIDETNVVRFEYTYRSTRRANANSKALNQELGAKDPSLENELWAVEFMKLINSYEFIYNSGIGNGSFGGATELFYYGYMDPELANASGVALSNNVDGRKCNGDGKPRYGYRFKIKFSHPKPNKLSTYSALAIPLKTKSDRRPLRSFFVDDSQVIRFSDHGNADADSDALNEDLRDPDNPRWYEEQALAMIRYISQTQLTYRYGGPGKGHCGSAEDLFKNDFIDPELANATGVPQSISNRGRKCKGTGSPRFGYRFTIVCVGSGFRATAVTASASGNNKRIRTGRKNFYVDETCVFRYTESPELIPDSRSPAINW